MATAARARNRLQNVMALALPFGPNPADPPPVEFRVFTAGPNTTTKGTYVFDELAAKSVMAAYQEHGNDIMLDLEHLSLESPESSVNFDPDARGWAKLEVRAGELWAVGVTWTGDGAARLTEKRQRYVSPAFEFDPETRRITRVINIAITALPATDHTPALVAASDIYTEGNSPMSPEQFAQIAEALGLGADANVEDVLATISAMVKKIQDAANGTGGGDKPADEPKPDAPGVAAAEAAPPVVAASKIRAATRALSKLSGKTDLGQIVREIEVWRTSHLTLEDERAKLSAEKALLDGGERRRLVGDLVKLGAEIPATAWSDDKGTVPAEPWASMPIEQLRTRVEKLSKAKGQKPAPNGNAPQPPPGGTGGGSTSVKVDGESVELSASEVEACTDAKAKLEDYARNKLIRLRAQKKTEAA